MLKLILILFALYMIFAMVFPKARNVLAKAYIVLTFAAIIGGVITGYWW